MKFFLLFIFINFILMAHPHVFIVSSAQVLGNNKKINGIRVIWEWDEIWSQDIINSCDLNFDGKFDKKEMDLVNKDWFSALKSGNYFTKIILNNKEHKIKNITSFKASISKYNTVVYDFSCLIDEIAVQSSIGAKIIFEDPTMYIAFDEYFEFIKSTPFLYSNNSTKETSKYGIQATFDITNGGK